MPLGYIKKTDDGQKIMTLLNETHDINLTSWVTSANYPSDFPIQNLPFSTFRKKGTKEAIRGGVAIGDYILDMAAVAQLDIFSGNAQRAANAAAKSSLNDLMAMGKKVNSALRLALSQVLRNGALEEEKLTNCLVLQTDAEYAMPCQIGDYTDFYTSIHHATAVGSLFRPDTPLLPNYKWIPIGYHGRSSTIDISGQKFPRPMGQLKAPEAEAPVLAPCKRLDYEVEMGIFIGESTQLGERIGIEKAEDHIFGLCLFNDWSARDIQAWEYQPLGPFLAKNFASTISPWIVTIEALAPYRMNFSHPENDPQPLPYLSSQNNSRYGGLDIQLECFIQTEKMRNNHEQADKISESNFKYSYWTIGQLVTHHSVNGCAMKAGDLLGSGTQSGPEHKQAGSMLELSHGGKIAFTLSNGEKRTFLEDGDTVIMRGFCQKEGAARIGFGEVTGTILPCLD